MFLFFILKYYYVDPFNLSGHNNLTNTYKKSSLTIIEKLNILFIFKNRDGKYQLHIPPQCFVTEKTKTVNRKTAQKIWTSARKTALSRSGGNQTLHIRYLHLVQFFLFNSVGLFT